ncbi:MAG TPA: response regulator [Kofleriaceae bacterium]|jgi:FixJ family two-component response regulator
MVLLVDDDEDLVEMFVVLFTKSGIPHMTARSLAAVKALGPRVDEATIAFIDVNLGPNQPSGVAIARWLRESAPKLTIYFITGHAPDHPLVIEARGEAGEILAKPIDTRKLIEIARRAV